MSNKDLQITLSGKDVSASDALRGLARAANMAAKSAGDSLDEMNRRVTRSSNESARSVTSGFGSTVAGWAQSGLAGILGGVAASVTSTVTGVVADAGQAIMTQLKSSVIDYNSQLENATIGFTTMLGSGSKATDFLNTLQAFARRTPFQFGDLTQYAQQMLGYGIKAKEILPDLTALGDAASAAGRTDQLGNVVLAFEQMSARGRVDLQDINQLTQGGVPALKILASSYHVTTGKMLEMISTGKLMSSDALPKLTKGIEKGTSSTKALGGMMTKQSATFAGAMSNIHDAVDQTLSKAFLPFFKILERGAGAISKFAGSKAVQKWATDTSKTVGHFLTTVGGGIGRVFNDPKVQSSLGKLGKALSDAFKDVGPSLRRMLPDAVKFGRDVLPAIIDAVTGVVKHLPEFLRGVQSVGHELRTLGPGIAGVIRIGGDLINWLIDAGAAFAEWHDKAETAIVAYEATFIRGLKFVGGLVGRFTKMGSDLVQGLINGITGMASKVVSTAQNLAAQVAGPFSKLLQFGSPSKLFRKYGIWVGEGLRNGLLGSVDQIKSAADKIGLATTSPVVKRLEGLSKQRAALLGKVSDLRSDRASVVSSTKSATIAAGGVMNYSTTGDAIQGLEALVHDSSHFKSDLRKLAKAGIGRRVFSELVEGWQDDPQAALRMADQLVANPVDRREISSLENQLGSIAGSLGTYAGRYEYNDRIDAAKGKAKVVGWRMQKEAAKALEVHVHVNGHYAGTKDDLAKTIKQVIHDAVKKGVIPKNWATA